MTSKWPSAKGSGGDASPCSKRMPGRFARHHRIVAGL
jgi:hypothetical protein